MTADDRRKSYYSADVIGEIAIGLGLGELPGCLADYFSDAQIEAAFPNAKDGSAKMRNRAAARPPNVRKTLRAVTAAGQQVASVECRLDGSFVIGVSAREDEPRENEWDTVLPFKGNRK
jgi:hypothetical protein